MILKLSLAFMFLLSGTTIAGPVEQPTRYSFENIWKVSATTRCKPDWMEGVQKYYDDIIETYNKFPDQLKDRANVVTIIFENYLTKLVNYSNSDSAVVSTGSIAILEVLGKVKLQANTPEGVINELNRMLHNILTKAYSGVISKLSKQIGEKASCSVNDAMADLESAYTKYMKEFLQEDELGLRKPVDYKLITKSAEKFKKTIARVSKKSKSNDPDKKDAYTVLTLILDHLMICYYVLSSSSEAILY